MKRNLGRNGIIASGNHNFGTIDFSTVTDIYAYGDSYTNPGLQATGGGTPAANSYIPKLLAIIGKGVTNRGATGTGIWTAYNAHLNNDVFPRVRGVLCMTGLNDTNRNGSGSTFVDFWKEQMRTMIYANMITSGTPGSDLTLAGGWFGHETAGAGYNKAHQFGAGKKPILIQTAAANSATYAFSGKDHVIFQYMISTDSLPAYTWLGTIQVKIDGVVVENINCHVTQGQSFPGWENGNTNYLWRAKMYTGLSLGAHTISFHCTAVNSGGVNVDYVGHLGTDKTDTSPLLLGHVTYITNYAQAAPYNVGSDAAADAVNAATDAVIAEVKAVRPAVPILAVKTNTDPPLLNSGDYHADGLHWNDNGHDKGKQKFLNRISAY